MQRFVQFALALVPATTLACATAPTVEPFADYDMAAPPPPPVQEMRYGTYEGESQISIGASIAQTSVGVTGTPDSTTSSLNLQLGYGYFLSDALEIGGQVTVSSTEPEGPNNSSSNFGILPYIRWNFRGGETSWFYVGAHTGFTSFQQSGQDSESAVSFGAHGGWKLWISPETAFFIEPRFTSTALEFGQGPFAVDVDINEFLTLLGFTISI